MPKHSNHSRDSDKESDLPNKKFRGKHRSRDAKEGRTLFIKNLSFDTTKEDLEELLKKFGELEYCVICIDKEFDHPKGTAFAKFKNKDDADSCIKEASNDGERFTLDGRRIEVHLAMTRGQIKKTLEARKLQGRDRRNIYLAREGVIYPDMPAAEGVSKTDLEKRMQLEMAKRRKLLVPKNFISPYRLLICNIPLKLTDVQLRKIFIEAVDDNNAVIKECKIIREVDKNGNLGKSKGFGFVSFSRHEHALKALRKLNNNPKIFKSDRRPIIEFVVEKISAIKKRAQSSNSTIDSFLIAPYLMDYKEEDYPYMGMKARRFRENEAIKAPKLNRKVVERMKALRKRKESKHHKKVARIGRM